MSFTRFEFSKNWENPADFPTYEENEEQVRADMQCLYDELKDALNGLMTALEKTANSGNGASNIGIRALTSLPGVTNVMDAIATIMTEMANIQAGTVLPGSVTDTELADSAVTTPKVAAGAITGPKLASGAVTNAKCDFSAGLTIPGTLNQQGQIILDSDCYGDELPSTVTPGRLFFKKVGSGE